MDIAALILLLIVLVLVVLFVMAPFTDTWRVQVEQGHQVSFLLAERDRVLSAIQELDFDRSLGKIPEQEYPAQRADLMQEGVRLLRQLDEVQKAQSQTASQASQAASVQIPIKEWTDEDLENLIAQRRSVRKVKSTGFCPNCGKPIVQSDRFCPACGQSLSPEPA